ncbi:LexA family protein [Legionella fairfieldensis]|uniref:LexA family protein n=1 Tax=Legionella fairfieldensis TaxID=45064 RepID=UPI000689010D|nr:S24 family peptidase [Legionella fairfieldensis]
MTYVMPINNREIGEILQELIKINEINVSELARRVNLPQPTIQRIVAGAYKQPRNSTIQPIADYFGVTINQLRGFEPISFLSGSTKIIKSIPLLSSPQINIWPDSKENINQYVVCDINLGEKSFAMHMPDSSMEPIIPKGSILLIDPTRIPHHGSFIVLKLQNFPEIIVRQLITDTKNRFIKPLSPELNHLEMNILTSDDIIRGVVVEIRLIFEEY